MPSPIQRPRPARLPATPTRTPRPVTIAVTGGIGAGKSEALRAFAHHGAATISSDEIVHRLLRDEAFVKHAVVQRFGDGVLDPGGEIDRAAVARVVFADREELGWLEGLLHPLVLAAQARWRGEQAALTSPPQVCVVEVPLLYETGGESRFDAVVVVTAPPDVRAARARHADSARREERLLDDEEKARRADFAYVNDGTLEELDAFVAGVVERLTATSA